MQIDELISQLELRLADCERTNQLRPSDDDFNQGIDCRVVNEIIFLDKLLHDYRVSKPVEKKPQSPAPRIYRGWFNQPSTLQRHHKFHGERCIVEDRGGLTVRAWFSGGPIHSMEVERNSITSEEW